MRYLMSLDQGTTSSRCIIFDEYANTVAVAQKEFTQYYPHSGWVEHDALEILDTQISVAREALKIAGLCSADISALGITNQRETTIVWNKNTGKPYANAIVWQCRRTTEYCKHLKETGHEKMIREKTGLLIDPYFSATKIKWLLDNIPGLREDAEKGDALFGTVDSFLLWNISGKKVHATDVSNASRTMLFNINTLKWDDDLLELFDIPAKMMPQIVDSSGIICKTDPAVFGGPITVAGIAGDQQSAMFGQGCFEEGECKNTYGTGCFLLMNTGSSPIISDNGLLTTVAWKIGENVKYANEGSVFIGGAAIQWLRDEMKLINDASESEYESKKVSDTDGCYVVPAFTGLGAPHWDPDARGIITGITRGTTRAHIIRATLESIAYQVDDVLKLMSSYVKSNITKLSVDGGASKNNLLMQFQSDISALSVVRPACVEVTALGASLLAALAVGIYKSTDEIRAVLKQDRIFDPEISVDQREKLLSGWHDAVKRCKSL